MRFVLTCFVACTCFPFLLTGQENGIAAKPVLTPGIAQSWPLATNGKISNDGKFVYYAILHKPAPGMTQHFVAATQQDWKLELAGVNNPQFTPDSKWLVWKQGMDSVAMLDLGKKSIHFLKGIKEYQLAEQGGQPIIAFRQMEEPGDLILFQVGKATQKVFTDIVSYEFSPSGGKLILETTEKGKITCLDMATGRQESIWDDSSSHPIQYVYSRAEDRLLLLAQSGKDNRHAYAVYYIQPGKGKAVLLADHQSTGIPTGYTIGNARLQFSADENYALFPLQPPALPTTSNSGAQVDVWSYRDTLLYSAQLNSKYTWRRSYTAAVSITARGITRIEAEHENIRGLTGSFALVQYNFGSEASYEAYWNPAVRTAWSLLSLNDGTKTPVYSSSSNTGNNVNLSPGGRWLIWYDEGQQDFFSYEVSTGLVHNISSGSGTSWTMAENQYPEGKLAGSPSVWLAKDEGLLINDTYDLWLLDPAGIRHPRNLTRGRGKEKGLMFRVANPSSIIVNKKGEQLLLRATDTRSQDRGFYQLSLDGSRDPEKLTMGPYIFGDWVRYSSYGEYTEPVLKAKNAQVYLVTRQSAQERSNYFVTSDFKQFKPLTNEQPQRSYNWYTTELIHWPMPDGGTGTGILYKPENFDAAKKYAVIFDYYEQRSDELNLFILPRPSTSRINIPLFVSAGYLILVPDMQYRIGAPLESAVETVTAAADYLSRLPYVDSARLGLQGHSWGGYQTNYIITQTNRFRAACSAAGTTDLLSAFGSQTRGGYLQYHLERTQGRMGGTLWDLKEEYLKNSAVLFANKVYTPLLIMHNKSDGTVDFSQGVEFFTGLRRLGKPVWLLQYDKGNHSIDDFFGPDAWDYHTRMMQFFDHYLKGSPAPRWMTRGIPARMKGIDDGLELDKDIQTPGPGLKY